MHTIEEKIKEVFPMTNYWNYNTFYQPTQCICPEIQDKKPSPLPEPKFEAGEDKGLKWSWVYETRYFIDEKGKRYSKTLESYTPLVKPYQICKDSRDWLPRNHPPSHCWNV